VTAEAARDLMLAMNFLLSRRVPISPPPPILALCRR
jgi:hypothetical protein